MRSENLWEPSKFIETIQGWSPSSDRNCVGVGSRFVASIQLASYYSVIRKHACGDLLDLGCGKVPYYGIYRDLVRENICADWNRNLFVNFVVDLNKSLPVANGLFDTVLCTDVLEHLYNPSNAFSEMTRVLKPGGKLILCVPFLYYLHEEPHDYFRYTEHSLRRFSKENQLEVVLLLAYGGALETILDIIAKNISSHSLLSAIHLNLSLAFANSKVGKSISQNTNHRFPLGYCLVAKKNL